MFLRWISLCFTICLLKTGLDAINCSRLILLSTNVAYNESPDLYNHVMPGHTRKKTYSCGYELVSSAEIDVPTY